MSEAADWLDAVGIPQWAKWCKSCRSCGLGYPSRTMEGRLRDGELPGIKSKGKFIEGSNDAAEVVERAVRDIAVADGVAAFVFRQYHVRRNSYRKISHLLREKMGVRRSHTSVSSIEKDTYSRIVELIGSD